MGLDEAIGDGRAEAGAAGGSRVDVAGAVEVLDDAGQILGRYSAAAGPTLAIAWACEAQRQFRGFRWRRAGRR